jgi:hypothetical protein
MSDLLSVSDIANELGCQHWQVRKALDGGPVPVQRVGLYRTIRREHLPQVEAALRQAGYLPGERQ